VDFGHDAPPHLHAPRRRFLAVRMRTQLCKLSTRRIKARSTTRGSCSANNLRSSVAAERDFPSAPLAVMYRVFRTVVGLAAPNLAELEVGKANQGSEKEPS